MKSPGRAGIQRREEVRRMPENFVLERNQSKRERWSTIRVKADTYQIIAEWAYQTGKPISEVTHMAIAYAKEHEVIVDG